MGSYTSLVSLKICCERHQTCLIEVRREGAVEALVEGEVEERRVIPPQTETSTGYPQIPKFFMTYMLIPFQVPLSLNVQAALQEVVPCEEVEEGVEVVAEERLEDEEDLEIGEEEEVLAEG
ncbi:MAG: hypothetical protein Q9188_000842, partial [Gyalolechia gomerana]